MKKFIIIILLMSVFVYSCDNSVKEEVKEPGVYVTNPRVREIPPGVEVTAGYLEVENYTNINEKLARAESKCFSRIEIHNTFVDEDETVRMEKTNGVIIKPGEKVSLTPGGYHLMLNGLKCDLSEINEIPIKLYFQKLGKIVVNAKIEKIDGDQSDHSH